MARQHTFMMKPGAFVDAEQPLTERHQQQISERWPGIPLDRIESAVVFYKLRRALLAEQPDGKEMRKTLAQIRKQVDGLLQSLHPIQQSNLAKLVNATGGAHGEPAALDRFVESLARFRGYLGSVEPPAGRAKPARDYLIEELADIVADAGLGNVNALTFIVLESLNKQGLEERYVDLPKLLKRVLGKRSFPVSDIPKISSRT